MLVNLNAPVRAAERRSKWEAAIGGVRDRLVKAGVPVKSVTLIDSAFYFPQGFGVVVEVMTVVGEPKRELHGGFKPGLALSIDEARAYMDLGFDQLIQQWRDGG